MPERQAADTVWLSRN